MLYKVKKNVKKDICYNCGYIIIKGTKVCPHCGKRQNTDTIIISILILFVICIGSFIIYNELDKQQNGLDNIILRFKTLDNNESNSEVKIKSGTLVCTKVEFDENGYKITDTMNVTYKDNKVKYVKETNISEVDSNYLDLTLSIGYALAEKLNQINGMKMSYSKESDNEIKFVLETDYNELTLQNIKDTLEDLFDEEDAFYSDTNITIDDFKTEKLNGYKCN